MDDGLRSDARELARLLRGARHPVVLTGAGVSTESGIPDFRTPGSGLWTHVNPMEILSVTALATDPRRFYDFKIPLWRKFIESQPNAAHLALAEMEGMGAISCVITQNIDSLHTRAGSQNVLEVHGHMRTGRCLGCGVTEPFETLVHRVEEENECPPQCTCGGTLRPNVVLFGDGMAGDFEAAVDEAIQCDLMLVVGSSLEVSPANSLPEYARHVAILNVGPTACDREAIWQSHAKAGELLPLVVEALKAGIGAEAPNPA